MCPLPIERSNLKSIWYPRVYDNIRVCVTSPANSMQINLLASPERKLFCSKTIALTFIIEIDHG